MKQITSYEILEALINITETQDQSVLKDIAMEEYDHEFHQYVTTLIELETENIKVFFTLHFEVNHILECEGEFTPSDHSLEIVDANIENLKLWIGDTCFKAPITKKVKNLIFNHLNIPQCLK